MSVQVIKAITKRIRLRMGSTENAAIAAGVTGGVWSHYENSDHPNTSIPLHRFMMVANGEERAALVRLMEGDDPAPDLCLNTEAGETTEASADMQRVVREAQADGVVTPLEAKRIREAALKVQTEAGHVMAGVS